MIGQKMRKALEDFLANERPRLQKLEDYYTGKHAILKKKDRLEEKTDSKVVHSYPEYISTIATAYFVGKPISYVFEDGANEETAKDFGTLSEYLSTEEEQDTNYQHAENCSVFGRSFEILYKEYDGRVGLAVLDPRDVVVLYDTSVKKKLIAAARWDSVTDEDGKQSYIMEVYDDRYVTEYRCREDQKDVPVKSGESRIHGFDGVPVIEYVNNIRKRSDFESVISLVDAYNEAESTSLDDLKDFTDAFLALTGLEGTEPDDIKQMKRDKVLLLPEESKAEWITKTINDAYTENIKNRLNDDIHKFSMVPNLQDKEFAGNSSGVALAYKLLALEQLTAKKEMSFKKALNKRLALMIDFLNLKINPQQIQKVFTRNTPKNLVEIADTVTKLSGLVSNETLLSNIPFIENAETEMAKKREEDRENLSAYEDMNTPLPASTKAGDVDGKETE